MEVCIVGGGLCSIICSKVALDQGLVPFVLNRSRKIGGLWNPEPPGMRTWDSLYLNGSKHVAAFSDSMWPADDSMFPPGTHFKRYLLGYVEKHKLSQYYHNECNVTLVEKQSTGYLVTWQSGAETFKKHFAYVIIANGRFNQPYSSFPVKDDIQIKVIHSGEYTEPGIFKDKKVVIVGKGVSGSEIALDALKTAQKVTQIWRRKMIILPKMLNGLPYDFYFNKIENFGQYRHFVNFTDVVVQNQSRLINFAGNPGEILKEWEITQNDLIEFGQHGQHACTNEYVEAVKANKINCVQGNVQYLTKNTVCLEGGRTIEADVIVICTGYTANFDFLSDEIKEIIEYDKKNKLLPFISYRRVLHPKLPGLGFVGYLFGAAGRYECQAEIVMRNFCGKLLVSEIELWQGVNLEQWMRISLKNNYAAYDPFGYLKECLRILRVQINMDYIKGRLNFANGIHSPYFLFTDRVGQAQICEQYVKELKSRYPKL